MKRRIMLIGTLPFFLRFSISPQAATIPAPTSVAGRPMISAPPMTAGKIQSASFSFMSVQPHCRLHQLGDVLSRKCCSFMPRISPLRALAVS